MIEQIILEVARDGHTGGIQLSINKVDENGMGHGYRIAGPKFSGSGSVLLSHVLDERDALEIERYLSASTEHGANDQAIQAIWAVLARSVRCPWCHLAKTTGHDENCEALPFVVLAIDQAYENYLGKLISDAKEHDA